MRKILTSILLGLALLSASPAFAASDASVLAKYVRLVHRGSSTTVYVVGPFARVVWGNGMAAGQEYFVKDRAGRWHHLCGGGGVYSASDLVSFCHIPKAYAERLAR